MSRFAPLSHRNKAASTELINWGDPGDYRNRATVPSTDPKYAKRDPAFRPQVPASSAKAMSACAAPKASAPTKPVKSAATIAAEAAAARIAQVMNSAAAIGKVKSAAELLGNTKLTPAEIVAKLATAETDDARKQAEISDTWSKAIASVNARNGFPANDEQPAPQKPFATKSEAVWSKAIAKVNQINGFTGEAV
jgi:hypothetical protein